MDERGILPFNLLAVTFTNKAAQEMRDRVANLAGNAKSRELFIGTFHSLCLRILKVHADKLGYQPGFTIYDDSDQKALIKECLWELKLDEKQVHPYAVPVISAPPRTRLKTPKEYEEMAAGVFMERVAKTLPPLPDQVEAKQRDGF